MPNKLKTGETRQQKKFTKFLIIFLKYFFLVDYILSTWKDFIHSIWICYEKVIDNLVFWAILASS